MKKVITIEKTLTAEAVVEVPDGWTDRQLLLGEIKSYAGLDWDESLVELVDVRKFDEEQFDDGLPELEYII